MRFMAMARFSCASLLIDPNDIAPVTKRLTISLAGLNLIQGNRLAFAEVEQAANSAAVPGLIVNEPGVFLERRIPGDADRLLEFGDRVRFHMCTRRRGRH